MGTCWHSLAFEINELHLLRMTLVSLLRPNLYYFSLFVFLRMAAVLGGGVSEMKDKKLRKPIRFEVIFAHPDQYSILRNASSVQQ